MKKYAAPALRVLLVSAAAIVIYVKAFEHRLIYYPDREMAAIPSQPYEDVTFAAADNIVLHGWWLPVPASTRALIVSHGNAGNISHRTGMGDFLRGAFGMNVLMYDYRGYGRSEGEPSEAGTYSDIRAAYAHVRERRFEPASIFLMGQSLGSAIAVDLAAAEPVGGVILEAPFTSVRAVASRLLYPLPLGRLLATRYDSLAKIGSIKAPIAIVHAVRDPVIRFEFGRQLFEAASRPKEFFQVDAGTHEGTIMTLDADSLSKLRVFLEGKMGT